ncbi:unnamed protein product, partial [Trichobilharzia regenti]
KGVTVSESSSDSTILQGITSQNKGIKPVRICGEEPESAAVNKEFENDEVDHAKGGKVDICDNGHDSVNLSLADHDETSRMPTTPELNKSSVHLKREVESKADAVAEGLDTHETVSVNDQRVAQPSTDGIAKPPS